MYVIKSYGIIVLCYFIRTEGSAKQTAESDNGHVANPLRQLSLQYDTAKDRYTNTSTTSSKPSVIGVDSYKFNHRKMGYAIFIINSEFDDQKTRPFADLDYRKMSELFWTLGFEIKILNNKTNADLKMCLAGMYALGQSLMIPIISH